MLQMQGKKLAQSKEQITKTWNLIHFLPATVSIEDGHQHIWYEPGQLRLVRFILVPLTVCKDQTCWTFSKTAFRQATEVLRATTSVDIIIAHCDGSR